MAPLLNKKVVIVGGSSGIGFGVARAALAEGASVLIASSNSAKLHAALARLDAGERATAEVLDIRSEDAIKKFFEKIGTFDHLVYSPGEPVVFGFGDENAKASFDLRYWGMVFCAKHSTHNFVPSPTSSFTATSGTIADHPIFGWTLLAGVSGAIVSSVRNLAVDLAPVRFNTIVPGIVDTEMWDTLPKADHEVLYAASVAKIPVNHVGTAAEVAEAYLFLMKCAYVTGQAIYVDGGATIADRGNATVVRSSAA